MLSLNSMEPSNTFGSPLHTTVDEAPPAGFYKLMTHASPDLVEVRLVSRTESTTKR